MHVEHNNGRRENVVYARAGEKKIFLCQTGFYYGRATVKWLYQPASLNLPRVPKQLIGKAVTTKTMDGERFYQESQVEFSVQAEDDRGFIDCVVWSEGDVRIDSRVRLDIMCKYLLFFLQFLIQLIYLNIY